jgi:hypothetical protein
MSAYEVQGQEKIKAVAPDPSNGDTSALEVKSEGSESSEGSRICGFIIE